MALDDTLHASDETIPAASLVSEGALDFEELQDVPRENYDFDEEIARGGMGRIIAARDRRTGRPIVIKEVRADLMAVIDDPDRDVLIRRFKREAMLTARLQHPAVVPVYEIGRFGDTPFIAMKRVVGTPLLDLLEEAETLRDRMALLPSIIAVADAIAYAHSENVIHRDLKPANILVGSFGETVVIDWGLAKLVSEGDELIDSLPPVPGDVETVAGAVFGTPAYMPPEQATGAGVGPAADVYALGALLYHMLAGEAPYSEVDHDSTGGLIDAVREGPPLPLADVCPDAPADLVSVAERAMARAAADRYSAAELVAELRSFQSGKLVSAHDYTVWELLRRWVRRHRALVLTATALVVAGAIAISWFVVQMAVARANAEQQGKRANERLKDAMVRTAERGMDELEHGYRRKAIAWLAEAYPHLDDPRVARMLAEALRGARGFAGELARFGLPVEEVRIRDDGKRVAALANGRIYLMTTEGERLRETEGREVVFAGSRLLTFEGDERVVSWSSDTGDRLGEHRFGKGYIGHFAYTPDVLFGTSGTGVIALRLDTMSTLFEFEDNSMMAGVGVSADGERFMAVSLNTRIWDKKGTELMRLPGFQAIEVGAFAPDGSELMRVEPGGIVRYSADGKRLGRGPQSVQWVKYSEDGTKVLYRKGMYQLCVKTLDEPAGGLGERCELEDADSYFSYSANFETLAIGAANGDVLIRDGGTGVVRQVIAATELKHPLVELTPDGKRLVTGGSDGSVRLWDIGAKSYDAAIDHRDLKLVYAGELIMLANERQLEIWDPDRPTAPIKTLEVEADAKLHVSVSDDGKTLAWGGWTWDMASGRRLAKFPDWVDHMPMQLDAEGRKLFGRSRNTGLLDAYSARTGELLWTFDPEKAIGPRGNKMIPMAVRIGPRDELLLQGAGIDVLVDIESGELLHELPRDDGSFGFAAVFLATGVVVSIDGAKIYLSDIATGRRRKVIWGSGHSMVAHPDGARVLLPLERTMQLYDTRTGEGRTLPINVGFRGGAAFSPDGQMVALAQRSGSVELYDVESLSWLGRRHAYKVDMVAFSKGGRLLAIGAKRTLIFDLAVETRSPEQLAREVRRVLGKGR